ncbi:C40 family peptidase [Oceaniglobus trochenteri]|uniref:C40 family peptidase n=1 Tax=Oceaniglobus trochenteri TaxID=2763260 RepID=UPI001CFFBD02|nr:NlpC/P60 family protein [Oceaniglobus trochenteri]
MNWSARYIGLPFRNRGRDLDGCDCWGLARLVYGRELGIELPGYGESYACVSERAEISALIGAATEAGTWRRVSAPAAFDLHLLRNGLHDSHVAIAVDAVRMLHMDQGQQARVVRLDDPRWSRRYVASFRHADLEGRP